MISLLKKVNKKNIFLVDGVGAIVSATFLGIVLPLAHKWIRMPVQTLYLLGFLALLFSIYSLSCFFWADHKDSKWLKFIISVNLSYCFLTSGLVYYYLEAITLLGSLYFLGEVIVILAVVKLEKNVLLTIQ